MSEDEIIKENRAVADFDYVILKERLEGELTIIPSDKEELTIEGLAEIVQRINVTVENRILTIKVSGSLIDKMGDLLKTSLNRKKTKYTLYIKQLRGLEINGVTRTRCNGLKTRNFTYKSSGVARTSFTDLHADTLDITLSNIDKIDLDGVVEEQNIIINGTSQYDGAELKSTKAKIALNGIGKATLWVTDDLIVKTNGIGNISYYGSPRIDSRTSMLTSLTKLGETP